MTLHRSEILLILAATALTACGDDLPATSKVFTDVAAETGLGFMHSTGASGEFLFNEINGAGAALFDYDNDGDLDVLLVQSAGGSNRLFRNELLPAGTLRFSDVTEAAGCAVPGYGMGAATGDYDNDGDADLYLLNFGSNLLCRNNGDGSFSDVTKTAGADDPRWSSSGSFVDIDHDGDLDLYVVNYVEYSAEIDRPCQDGAGQRDYCAPSNYAATSDSLLLNNGDGSFTDVSESSGIAAAAGPGLGVVATDIDGDDLIDLYVANDQAANFLWINRGDGKFEDTGLLAGAAYNGSGAAEASMGVTAGDYDGDGDPDLFMTHLSSQSNTLYVNDGSGGFVDGTEKAGLGATSMRFTGFGSAWFDYDNDGLLDLFVANGAVMALPERRGQSDFPYEQTNQLFRNLGNGRFADVSGAAGLTHLGVSRGAAFGDIDNDGDIDVLVTNNRGPARLLLNAADAAPAWIRLRLEGTDSPRDGQGARVGVETDAGPVRWSQAHTDGSFASASDPRVHFGLGDTETIEALIVHWPSGVRERWNGLATRREHLLREGSGKPL